MNSEPRIPDPDGFYHALITAHEGLADERSARLNVALVMLLANQVGDQAVLLECIRAARAAVTGADAAGPAAGAAS